MAIKQNKMFRKFCDITRIYPANTFKRKWLRPFFNIQNLFRWRLVKIRIKGNIDDAKNYKDIHKGERCFIIGNGPSINKTNLSLIKNEITFATNRFYKGMDKFEIKPTYYVVSNRAVIKQGFNDGLEKINIPLFLGQPSSEIYTFKLSNGYKPFETKVIPIKYKLKFLWKGAKMSTDIEKGNADGGTVITDCIQIAYYMGFKKVYLLGCDCNAIEGEKVRHFYKGYVPGCDDQWVSVPRWFKSYEVCKKAFEEDGREIFNATVGGALEVFRRKNLEEIMKEK